MYDIYRKYPVGKINNCQFIFPRNFKYFQLRISKNNYQYNYHREFLFLILLYFYIKYLINLSEDWFDDTHK